MDARQAFDLDKAGRRAEAAVLCERLVAGLLTALDLIARDTVAYAALRARRLRDRPAGW